MCFFNREVEIAKIGVSTALYHPLQPLPCEGAPPPPPRSHSRRDWLLLLVLRLLASPRSSDSPSQWLKLDRLERVVLPQLPPPSGPRMVAADIHHLPEDSLEPTPLARYPGPDGYPGPGGYPSPPPPPMLKPIFGD